jgi:hypothetical protein
MLFSLWIKRTPSTAMSGRIFDFGAGTFGEFEHYGQKAGKAPGGLTITSGDYGVNGVLHDGVRSYPVKAVGQGL